MTDKGVFIVFEGIDGSGKTTQINLLKNYFESLDVSAIYLKEPTDYFYWRKKQLTDIGAEIDLSREYQMLIEDRRINFDINIKPALKRGEVIIQDRYYYSTLAFQGTQGILKDRIIEDNKDFSKPDLVFILDIPVNIAKERLILKGEKVTMDILAKLEKARAIYRDLEGENIFKIQARFEGEKVHGWIIEEIDNRFDHLIRTKLKEKELLCN